MKSGLHCAAFLRQERKPIPPMKLCSAFFFLALSLAAQAPAPKPDPLGRQTPRSAVSSFLQACNNGSYDKAVQYLDLRGLPERQRAKDGIDLAKQLEGILNADPHFSVLRLSSNPEGNLADKSDPNRESIATVNEGSHSATLDLEREELIAGSPIWLVSRDTVLEIPRLASSVGPSVISRHLPPFLAAPFLATPLWEWIALVIATLILIAVARQFDRLLRFALRCTASRLHFEKYVLWIEAVIEPLRVLMCLILFRLGVELIGPSALARLYIGRIAQAVFVWSVAWSLMRLVELSLARVESRMDDARRFASRSVLHLGRRTLNTVVVILAILTVLSNWGYNTATLVAGLGVGGIAIALAAQQTIANIFGGVSVIADRPIRIGEYGKFGDLLGTLEDIGLRSTNIRTLNRTVVSVPNATFAGYNLENYSVRDKILFNPTLPVKRGTPEDRVRGFVDTLRHALESNKELEMVPTPVRITGLGGAAIQVEIFCYVLTSDINRFYVIQGDLYLEINHALEAAQIELA
jgi:MscS family membrane protein